MMTRDRTLPGWLAVWLIDQAAQLDAGGIEAFAAEWDELEERCERLLGADFASLDERSTR